MIQPELFENLSPEQKPRPSLWLAFPGRFVQLKVAYEDMVLGSLSVLLVLLAGFCLGVERGKRLNLPEVSEPASVGIATAGEGTIPNKVLSGAASAPAKPLPTIPASVPQKLSGSETGSSPDLKGSFSIQLASYVGQESAQVEAERLRRRGITVQVVHQGKYYELRAVGFRSWSEAKASLGSLKKVYPDAFIKRLALS